MDGLAKRLGPLVALLSLATIAYGISGGPFPAGKSVVGTYAGVLTPKASPCPSASPSPAPACSPTIAPCAANSLGVFSISAPQTGLASGTFVMFAQGRVFSGTIRGTADPQKSTLKGILSARYDFTVSATPCPCGFGGAGSPCPSPTPACTEMAQNITALANGSLNADIVTRTNVFTVTATRLRGTATLDISNGTVDPFTFQQNVDCEMFMKVSGFRQSTTASTSAVAPTGSL